MDKSRNQCQGEHIAAYLDGEVDASAGALFEDHLQGRSFCHAELNAQRLFVCELDSALTIISDLPMPRNFAEIVAARAESDMSGVRETVEHRRALQFCIVLALASFALLGAAASKTALVSSWAIAGNILSIFELLWKTLRDAAVGLAVISRVIIGGLVPESPYAGLAALLLALAVVLLSLLISSYHRHHEMRLSN